MMRLVRAFMHAVAVQTQEGLEMFMGAGCTASPMIWVSTEFFGLAG